MARWIRFACSLSCWLALGTGTVCGQERDPLAAVDSLIAQSRFREATAALDRWETENAASPRRAAGLLLRARMQMNGDSARSLYLAIAQGYPSSAEAPVALLRLAQHSLVVNDTARAHSYLIRIVRDYPNISADLRTDVDSTRVAARDPLRTRVTPTQSPPPQSARNTPASPPAAQSAGTGAFAVQVAAFRDPKSAATFARQVGAKGFTARVAYVPVNTLARVRVGRFSSARDADDVMKRLRAAGFQPVVVADARDESTTPKQ